MKFFSQDRRRLFLVLHLVSFSLLSIPSGLPWYYSNLAVYLNSYLYITFDSPDLSSPWVISVFLVGWCIATLVVGTVIKKVDHRYVALAGVMIFDVGFFISYLSVQYSPVGFATTFGFMPGLGFGILHSEIISRIARIFPRNTGFALSVPFSSITIGGLIYQTATTWYINPNNSGADVSVLGLYKIFDEKSVIDRVPSVFIVLGIITLLCHLCGLTLTVLLNDKGQTDDDSSLNHETVICKEENAEGSLSRDIRRENNKSNYESGSTSYTKTHYNSKDNLNTQRDKDDCSGEEPKSTPPGESAQQSLSSQNSKSQVDDVTTDLSNGGLNPRQMLKTVRFHILCISLFTNEILFVALMNFYKVFGQLWIHDDHFLTQLGLAMACVEIVFTVVWGMVIDRIGIKLSLIALTSSLVLICPFYFFTPQISRWLFSVFTTLLVCSSGFLYLTYDAAILKFFGPQYYVLNCGILGASTIFMNLILPGLFEFLLVDFGWSALFMAIAVTNCVSLVAQVFGLPNI